MYRSTNSRSGLLAALLLLTAALLQPGTASAQTPDQRQPVNLAVAGPEDVPLGNPARLIALLTDAAGKPVAAAKVRFTSPASFAGAVAEVDLGEVVTDQQGRAVLDLDLTILGQNQLTARFYGDAARQPAEASTIVVATGERQLVQRTAGLYVPGLSAWTLIVVLGSVWLVYFISVVLVAGIPERRPAPAESATGGRP